MDLCVCKVYIVTGCQDDTSCYYCYCSFVQRERREREREALEKKSDEIIGITSLCSDSGH